MARGRLKIIRLGVATLAAACSTVIMLALFTWAMTQHFTLCPSWLESLLVSAFVLGGCAIGSLALLPTLSLAQRFRTVGPWAAATIGGLLFWLAPSALLLRPEAGLFTIPAGIIAGLLLRDAGSDANAIGRSGLVALTCGVLVWLTLLVIPASEAWNERDLARLEPRKSLLGERLMGGAAFGAELWLFNASGKTVSFRLADWGPTLRSQSGVAALATSGPTMWVLQAPPLDWRAEHQPAARFRLASYASGRGHYSAPN